MNKQLRQFGVGTMIMLTLCTARLALAGDRGGNGGDAVVCRDDQGKIISAELLDYYEGRTRAGIEVADNQKYSLTEHTEVLFEKLKIMDPFFKKAKPEAIMLANAIDAYLQGGKPRQGDVLFTTDILADITDSEHLLFPRGCKVEQLAVRIIEKSYASDPNYLIQEEILRHLPLKDLKGLVSHEVIYKTYLDRDNKTKNSKVTRKFNQLISSIDVEELSLDNYMPTVKEFSDITRIWQRMDNGYYSKSHFYVPKAVLYGSDGKISREGTKRYGEIPVFISFVTSKGMLERVKDDDLVQGEYEFEGTLRDLKVKGFYAGFRYSSNEHEFPIIDARKKGLYYRVKIRVSLRDDFVSVLEKEEREGKDHHHDSRNKLVKVELLDFKYIKL